MKDNSFFQIGSFPALSMEEISSVFPRFSFEREIGANVVIGSLGEKDSPFENGKIAAQKKFNELGGSIRFGKLLLSSDSPDLVIEEISKRISDLSEDATGKICYGISLLPVSGERQQLLKTLLIGTKKRLRELQVSARFVNRDFRSLDAGTYFKESLYDEKRVEFVIILDGRTAFLGETFGAQNVESFADRDYGKPVRDMEVGMLPPKLALMMANFLRDEKGELPSSLWDPFSGTGSILIEAGRLGIKIYGSDLSMKMVEAAQKNLLHFFPRMDPLRIFRHDATEVCPKDVKTEHIAAEGYLGPIQTRPIDGSRVPLFIEDIVTLYIRFLAAVHKRFARIKIVLALPMWRERNGGIFRLPNVLEKAKKLGYTIQAFEHGTERGSLQFIRKDQVVGREILRLEKE